MQLIRDDETGSRIPRGDKYLLDAVMAAPLAAVVAVNLAAWRAAVKIGHWPVPWRDDPGCIMSNDVLLQVLYPPVYFLLLVALISPFVFPILMVVHRGIYPGLSRWMLLLIFAAGWVLITLDPGTRFTWFLD